MLNHTSEYADLTPQQFEVIGKIVVEWSNIEFLLKSLLIRLLCTPDFLGRVFTDEIMAARLQNAIDKAVKIHRHRYGHRFLSDEDLAEIVQLNADATRIRSKRNRFSHYCWCRSSDDKIFGTGFSGHVPPSKQVDNDSIVISVNELEDLYAEAHSIVDKLTGALLKIPRAQLNRDAESPK